MIANSKTEAQTDCAAKGEVNVQSARFRLLALLSLVSACLSAQEPSYRVEMVKQPGGFVRMVFVNDSIKDIDAYHVAIKCDRSTHERNGDVLGGPYSGASTIRASGGRWDTGPAIREDGRACEGTVDAVIYSDGSFDGPSKIVKNMYSAREGGFAAIQFWAALLVKPRLPGVESFSTVAEARVKEDRKHLENCRTSAMEDKAELICSYWSGRLHDDGSVLGILSRPTPPDIASPWRFENFVRSWKEKYANDPAMAELSRFYPPIPVE